MELWAWGANNYGQLGDGRPCEQVETPVKIPNVPELTKDCRIVCGGGNTFLLHADTGRVYATGWNNNGQLGLNDLENRNEFTLVDSLANVEAVEAGWDFSLALLKDNNNILGCGSNAFGQLGQDGKRFQKFVPVIVPNLPSTSRIKQVSCGLRHSLFLAGDGSVFGCGSNRKGQLNLSAKDQPKVEQVTKVALPKTVSSVKTGQNFSLVQFNDGEAFAFGDDKHGQVAGVNKSEKIASAQVECGWTHVAILNRETGTVQSWGRSDYGQQSQLTSDLKFKSISSGYEHVLGISKDPKLYAWGWNEHGNCGVCHTDNVLTPTQVSGIPASSTVISCFAGSGHSFAIVDPN